tara:strand:- start:358 stop:789 length:432 start_codon:yes stop_codon:yes gene_type:complete
MKTKKKTIYKEAVRNARAVCSTEQAATEMVQKQIDAGLVGDPKNRKTCAWKFEGTDMTINPSTGPNPKRSTKAGARNRMTDELRNASNMLKMCNDHSFEAVKTLHQEGTFSKIDPNAFIEHFAGKIKDSVDKTIFRFLEDYVK